jgi:hypothetical protein
MSAKDVLRGAFVRCAAALRDRVSRGPGRPAAEADDGLPGRRVPSPWWYGAAAALMAGGLALAAGTLLIGYLRFVTAVDSLARYPVPGQSAVRLSEPGTYTVFYEAADANPVDLISLRLSLSGGLAGGVGTEPMYSNAAGYSIGAVSAIVVERVTVSRPGTYRLDIEGDRGRKARIAVGRDPVAPLYRTALAGSLPGTALLLLGAAIALVTLADRRPSGHPARSDELTHSGTIIRPQ